MFLYEKNGGRFSTWAMNNPVLVLGHIGSVMHGFYLMDCSWNPSKKRLVTTITFGPLLYHSILQVQAPIVRCSICNWQYLCLLLHVFKLLQSQKLWGFCWHPEIFISSFIFAFFNNLITFLKFYINVLKFSWFHSTFEFPWSPLKHLFISLRCLTIFLITVLKSFFLCLDK